MGWSPAVYVAVAAGAEHAVALQTYAARVYGRMGPGRSPADSGRFVARQLAERAAAWTAFGDSVEVAVAWLPIAASVTDVADWLALHDVPSPVDRAEYCTLAGLRLGPLAWAAQVSLAEAGVLVERQQLDEERLKALAALAGRLVPGRWRAL
jgi:hypothetical protein